MEYTPGATTIDWPTVLPILVTLPAATPFVLEPANPRDSPTEQIIEKAKSVFKAMAELT